MIEVNWPISSWASSASAVADWTVASAGSTRSIAATSASSSTPSFAAMEIVSNCPSRSSSSCASATVNTANVAVPMLSTPPYWATPTSSKGRFGTSVAISTVSPSAKSCPPTVPASITTSPAADGQRPSWRFSGLNRSYSSPVSIPNPKLGAPPVLTASPSGSRIFVLVSS